jgi:hypothetical protein
MLLDLHDRLQAHSKKNTKFVFFFSFLGAILPFFDEAQRTRLNYDQIPITIRNARQTA